jgi:hypothetical protein
MHSGKELTGGVLYRNVQNLGYFDGIFSSFDQLFLVVDPIP